MTRIPIVEKAPAALAALTLAALTACGTADAQETFATEHGEVRVVTVAEGLREPWGLTFLPDGHALVTEQPGQLRVVAPDGKVSQPVSGLPDVAYVGQGGLLDVALDPAYADTGLIYLSYAEPGDGGAGTAVARARLDRDQLSLSGVEVIFRQEPKSRGGRHFGSRLVFARDGTLFVTVGDRGQRQRAQNFEINRGNVVRIDPDGTIPADNPFVGVDGRRPEVWSYGHRNPQGAALHPETGELWIHEHAAQGGDEINVPEAGLNYGWPVIHYGEDYGGGQFGEGTHKAGMEQPIYYWDPSIAPSGMDFYTGDRFPAWRGDLFVGALKYEMVVRLELDGREIVAEERILEGLDARIRAVRQGPDGLLYLLTDARNGRMLRLEPAGGW